MIIKATSLENYRNLTMHVPTSLPMGEGRLLIDVDPDEMHGIPRDWYTIPEEEKAHGHD